MLPDYMYIPMFLPHLDLLTPSAKGFPHKKSAI